jgi:hypothetical protein
VIDGSFFQGASFDVPLSGTSWTLGPSDSSKPSRTRHCRAASSTQPPPARSPEGSSTKPRSFRTSATLRSRTTHTKQSSASCLCLRPSDRGRRPVRRAACDVGVLHRPVSVAAGDPDWPSRGSRRLSCPVRWRHTFAVTGPASRTGPTSGALARRLSVPGRLSGTARVSTGSGLAHVGDSDAQRVVRWWGTTCFNTSSA